MKPHEINLNGEAKKKMFQNFTMKKTIRNLIRYNFLERKIQFMLKAIPHPKKATNSFIQQFFFVG